MKKDKIPMDKYGRPHGYWKYYHPNGKLWYKGLYIRGKKHGYCESYDNDGQLYYKGNCIHGKEHGYWVFYHELCVTSYSYYYMGQDLYLTSNNKVIL